MNGCVYCNGGLCKRFSNEVYQSHCGGPDFECPHRVLSNYDLLVAMNIDDLADYLSKIQRSVVDAFFRAFDLSAPPMDELKGKWLDFLSGEATPCN